MNTGHRLGAAQLQVSRTRSCLNHSLMTNTSWFPVRSLFSGFEADLAMAEFEPAGISSVRNSNDAVGIVGYGFQAATSQGATASVQSDMIDQARGAISLVE